MLFSISVKSQFIITLLTLVLFQTPYSLVYLFQITTELAIPVTSHFPSPLSVTTESLYVS